MMSAYAIPIKGPADHRRSSRPSAGAAANVRDHGHLVITDVRRVRTQSIVRNLDWTLITEHPEDSPAHETFRDHHGPPDHGNAQVGLPDADHDPGNPQARLPDADHDHGDASGRTPGVT
jgi:hypothetical protein